jgi:superfamily II DNA helicase RecQ
MQLKFFMIPATHPADMEAEVNAFLRGHRVLSVRKELVTSPAEAPFWAIAVEYLDSVSGPSGRGSADRIDYKEVLSEAEFEVFRRLREMRKAIAEEEGKPVYTVFTNAQLAQIVQRKVDSKAKLLEVEGVGEAKTERYGDRVLKVVKEGRDEAGQ